MWYFRGLFLAFPLVLLYFGFSILFLHFCFEKPAFGNSIHLSLTLLSLERLCKNIPLKIGMIVEAKNILVQNISGNSSLFI